MARPPILRDPAIPGEGLSPENWPAWWWAFKRRDPAYSEWWRTTGTALGDRQPPLQDGSKPSYLRGPQDGRLDVEIPHEAEVARWEAKWRFGPLRDPQDPTPPTRVHIHLGDASDFVHIAESRDANGWHHEPSDPSTPPRPGERALYSLSQREGLKSQVMRWAGPGRAAMEKRLRGVFARLTDRTRRSAHKRHEREPETLRRYIKALDLFASGATKAQIAEALGFSDHPHGWDASSVRRSRRDALRLASDPSPLVLTVG